MPEREIWCYCATCERWFYSPRDGGAGDVVCPVCGAEPAQVEERKVE